MKTVYTNENWFVISLSSVYFGDWVTKIRHFSLLKPIIAHQLRTSTNKNHLKKYFQIFCKKKNFNKNTSAYLQQNFDRKNTSEPVIKVGQFLIPRTVGIHRILGSQCYWRTNNNLKNFKHCKYAKPAIISMTTLSIDFKNFTYAKPTIIYYQREIQFRHNSRIKGWRESPYKEKTPKKQIKISKHVICIVWSMF